MNNQDFERLKALCEKEGFELLNESAEDNEKFFVIAKKKDEWDGVEFVEYLGHPWDGYNRSIFKVISISDKINVIDGSEDGGNFLKPNCQPSTEEAYIEQLKKEAFERFGEIKVGDRFDRVEIDEPNINRIGVCSYKDFRYFKEEDSLEFGGVIIYQDGKWAKRAPEKVKVEFLDDSLDVYNGIEEWGFTFGVHNHEYGNKLSLKAGQFLAKQLEKYLNDENC